MASSRSTAVSNQSQVVKWVLRFLVIGYLLMLVIWPTAFVVKHTFADGLTGIQDALSDPDVVHALKLTAQIAVIAVVINTVFGVGMSLLLVRHTFIGKALNGRRVPWRKPSAAVAVPAE